LPSTRHGATAASHETTSFHNPMGGFPDDVRIEDGCIWLIFNTTNRQVSELAR
jgi:hypothetical protein